MSASAFKTVNRIKTRRLTRPITASTHASPAEVVDLLLAVERQAQVRAAERVARRDQKGRLAKWLDDAVDTDRITVEQHDEQIRVSYPSNHASVGRSAGSWTAHVTMAPTADGGCEVTCELMRWVTRDKALRNDEEYLWFLDRLGAALSAGAASPAGTAPYGTSEVAS